MKHFDEMTAFLYLDGQLESAQSAEVQAHTIECSECGALLTSLKNETRWLETSLQEKDAVPARFAAPARHSNISWGWVTVLAMAAAGIYTVWNGMIEPFEQQLNQSGFSGGNLMTMLFFSGAFWKGWSSVLNFVEFFAVAAFSILVLALLQRFWRRGAMVGVVLASVAPVMLLAPFLLLAAPAAHAGDVEHGNPSYTLPAGKTVNTDLIVFADVARIDGTVNGDLFVWSGDVEVNGHVTGDVISFCREVRIDGQVDGNVRDWSQSLIINNGTVMKNVLAGAEEIEVNSKAHVGGSVTVGAGEALLSGRIGRDLMASTGTTTINGSVGGNAKLRGGNLRIGSTAVMDGSTTYEGHSKPVIDSGAKLASPVAFTQLKGGPEYSSGRYWWHRALFWGAAFLFGLVLILLLPEFFADAVRASRKLPSVGVGLVTMIATPIVAIILCVTMVGLGVGIATILVYAIALYAAQLFVATWLGGVLLGAGEGTGAMLGRLALGLVILHGLELLPYHAGSIVKLVVVWWGMGAIVIAIYRHIRQTSGAATPVTL